ncbi:MAG: hypothetical protein COT91_02800 [Candidatus Doudnabacteria bacterium CG10_big_fil_rev_8_21_14_0_10_41_10]|uniref:Glycosyltransferase 2-like domain-containing protein n=1 Tax=Candidatus Doudnabacteria bacterium CG10_big_fil_rev_8_21_14_0_10_41_10 TaxID=1974551 RepID=A0A2H0VFV1_9BACT|nr:MAG: hypothetical protein COT91_02800 [Candidatus Doudnabacteria bacterium CG10_big_fil_rev_8_21_14_0_10_41_10]
MFLAAKPRLYRFFEMIPGILTWGTFILAVGLSYYKPFYVAIFIILFDIYWLLKGINMYTHLFHTRNKMNIHERYNWLERCEKLLSVSDFIEELTVQVAYELDRNKIEDLEAEIINLKKIDKIDPSLDYKEIYHLVIMPTYKEPEEVLTMSIESYKKNSFSKDKIILVLAQEERAGKKSRVLAQKLKQHYENVFFKFLVIMHPEGIEGEAKVKGANLTFACKQTIGLIDELKIPYDKVIVSSFDADTVVKPDFFAQLTYTFLTTENRIQSSFQPVMLYNNNVWDMPAINRIASVSASYWQMIESSRPDRLRNFSSHSRSLKNLVDVDFWPVDVIPDDSQIFWRCFLHYNGNYKSVPLFTTLSMDGVLLNSYLNSLSGQYKQYRRWAWGVTDVPYVMYGFVKNKMIPTWKKILYFYQMMEGYYFWSTAPIIIAILGWLPLLLGGARFDNRVFASNLGLFTGAIMTFAASFLVISVVVYFIFLPKRPSHRSKFDSVIMGLQWIISPFTSIFFTAIPAVDAYTRLMLGKYMEFWVTPKHRRKKDQGQITEPKELSN